MCHFVYRINIDDTIIFLDSEWSESARNNGVCLRLPQSAVGRPLWEHIPDFTTRHLYKTFIERVRSTKTSLAVPFRCDVPRRQRLMELHIAPLNEFELEFKSILLHEHREDLGLDAEAGSTRPLTLLMCVWCKRMKASEWCDLDQAVRELKLFEKSKLPLISHVVCPECEARSLNAIVE